MQKIVALLIKTGYYRSNKSINDKVPPGTGIPDGTNSNDVAASKELFMSHFRGGHGFIVPPQRINGKSFSMENIGKGLFFCSSPVKNRSRYRQLNDRPGQIQAHLPELRHDMSGTAAFQRSRG